MLLLIRMTVISLLSLQTIAVFKINLSNLTSFIAIVFIIGLTLGSIFVVFIWSRDNFYLLNPYELKVLYFTLKQALISSVLVCILSIPISKSIFRNNFRFKSIFIKILGLPFIFPVVSAIFSIIFIKLSYCLI